MNRKDRILGCLLGGALGDAFGSAYEGQSPPLDFTKTRAWKLSDDTQLTLATCEAIIKTGGVVDPAAIAAQFALWHRERRVTGMGASTFKALTELVAGGHWALVGRKGERAAAMARQCGLRRSPSFSIPKICPHDKLSAMSAASRIITKKRMRAL